MLTLSRAVMSLPRFAMLGCLYARVNRGARRVHRFAVNAASDATPNSPDFVDHANTVAHDRYFAGRIMIPAHRNFAQPQAGEMSEVNQFDVETEARDLRGLDQRPAHVHAKGFEPALRVPVRQSGSRAHDEIENAPALFAAPRLMCANQAAIERA